VDVSFILVSLFSLVSGLVYSGAAAELQQIPASAVDDAFGAVSVLCFAPAPALPSSFIPVFCKHVCSARAPGFLLSFCYVCMWWAGVDRKFA
jgi:hypothetical protein